MRQKIWQEIHGARDSHVASGDSGIVAADCQTGRPRLLPSRVSDRQTGRPRLLPSRVSDCQTGRARHLPSRVSDCQTGRARLLPSRVSKLRGSAGASPSRNTSVNWTVQRNPRLHESVTSLVSVSGLKRESSRQDTVGTFLPICHRPANKSSCYLPTGYGPRGVELQTLWFCRFRKFASDCDVVLCQH